MQNGILLSHSPRLFLFLLTRDPAPPAIYLHNCLGSTHDQVRSMMSGRFGCWTGLEVLGDERSNTTTMKLPDKKYGRGTVDESSQQKMEISKNTEEELTAGCRGARETTSGGVIKAGRVKGAARDSPSTSHEPFSCRRLPGLWRSAEAEEGNGV